MAHCWKMSLTADVVPTVLGMLARQGPTLDRRRGLQNARVVWVVSAVASRSMMRQELKPQTRASNERTESKPMMKRVVLTVSLATSA